MKQINKTGQVILYILFTILLQSCIFSAGFAYEQHLTEKYYLIACDIEDDMCIDGSHLTVVPYTVFAAGYNENFIIAKQHPREFTTPINKSITNYYIIPVQNNPKEKAIGPLTLEQFKEKRKELNIPDSLDFTIEFEELK